MDELESTWDNLPTWAKWAIPIVAIGIIVFIWAPWRKKSNTQILPSGLNSGNGNATSYISPIATQTGLGTSSSGTSSSTSTKTPSSTSTKTPSSTSTKTPSSTSTTTKTHRIGEISTTFTNAAPDTTGGTSYTEKVNPSKNVVEVHNNKTGQNYTQTLNSYFNYLHNPVGALGSQYTHGQQVADTLYYHYGIKNNSQLLQALNNPDNPAHNVATEFHNILQSNAG
jgi:cytoskeletal protein RodZ